MLGKAGLGPVGGFDVSLLTVIIIVPENDVRRGDAQALGILDPYISDPYILDPYIFGICYSAESAPALAEKRC